MPFGIVVMVSGFGSNLQALIDFAEANPQTLCIRAVISNQNTSYALERAKKANIPIQVITALPNQRREDFDEKLTATLNTYQPDLIVLAGFMRILSAQFTTHWQDRLINIHPSLLPKYPGLNTHQRVIDAGESTHGVSVHYVNAQVDGGPIVAQAQLQLDPKDTAESLAKRIQLLEHQLLPAVVNAIATHKIHYNHKQASIQWLAKPLLRPLNLDELKL